MRLFILIISLLFSCYATAFQFENLNSIEQDDNNNFYLSSHDGVYRYDGQHFVALSAVTSLPSGLVRDIEYNQNILFTLYANGEIWRTDLPTLLSEKMTAIAATKIALTNTSLLTLATDQVKKIDLDTGVISTLYNGAGKVLDIDAFGSDAYLMTKEGVFLIQNEVVTTIEAGEIQNGDIAATPHGVVYFANEKLGYYSTVQQHVISNTEIKNADNIIFAAPYFVYFTENEHVHELTLTDLKITRRSINPTKKNYSELFADSNNRIWGVGLNKFEPVEVGLKSTSIALGSKYNVIESVDGAMWLGTTKGLYKKVGQSYTAIDWINEKVSPSNYEVTAMQHFKSGIALGTSVGAFYIDIQSNTVTKLHDDYVINFAADHNTLNIATNDSGVIHVDENLKVTVNKRIKSLMTTLEVLDVNVSGQSTYIASEHGLLHIKTDNWSEVTLDIDTLVTDSYVLNSTLFAATYGMGLWRKAEGGEWEQLSSPHFIKELVQFNNNLYLATNNGVHILENGADYTKLITGTEAEAFTIGSLKALGDRLYASSADHIFELTTAKSVELFAPKLTSITVNGVTSFNVTNFETNNSSIDVTISDYNFVGDNNNTFEFKLNGGEWQTLLAPGIQLQNLKAGTYKAVFRIENQGRYSAETPLEFKVLTVWYTSPAAVSAYIAVAILLVLAVFAFCYFWVQSFHKVYRKNQQRFQREELSDAVLKVHEAKALCGGDATMVTEGLVRLDDALLKLDPIARDQAALGKERLTVAIDMLHVHCSYQSDMELNFDVSLGDTKLDRQLEKDIYSVLYHSVSNALKHSQAQHLKVNVNKYVDHILVCVEDDGKGMSLYSRFHFGVGIYSIKQIAKTYKASLQINSSKTGTKMTILFPFTDSRRPTKEEIRRDVMARMD